MNAGCSCDMTAPAPPTQISTPCMHTAGGCTVDAATPGAELRRCRYNIRVWCFAAVLELATLLMCDLTMLS